MTEKLYNEILSQKDETIRSLQRTITTKDEHIAQLHDWINDLRGSVQRHREIINSLQLQQEEGKFFWVAGEA